MADPVALPPGQAIAQTFTVERDGRRLELFHEADRMAVVERVACIPLVYGRNVAYDRRATSDPADSGTADISIVSIDSSKSMVVVAQEGPDSNPHWSPDGTQIAFVTAMAATGGLAVTLSATFAVISLTIVPRVIESFKPMPRLAHAAERLAPPGARIGLLGRYGASLSDATIVTAVKQALAADPLVGRIPIEVDASNGNVRLISDQTGPDDRKQAVAIASKIDGVRQVEDRMR